MAAAELAPYSDVDILVACGKKTPLVEAVAGVVHPPDVGLAASSSGTRWSRWSKPTTALTRDMDIKTALIESRWVCGSKRVARALEKKIATIRRSEREEFLRRKIDDALARHEKFGSQLPADRART